MNITCMKSVLLEKITIASKAVATRTTNPILECLLLEANETGFRIVGNDLEIGIQISDINSEIRDFGTVVVEAKLLLEIVRKMPDDYINIFVDSQGVTHIKCGKVEFNINGLSSEQFPILPEVIKNEYYNLNSVEFKNIVRQTIFSVSVDESKPILTGELIEIKDGFLNVVAVDGFRISFRRIECNSQVNAYVVIPARTLNELTKIIPSEEDVEVSMYFTDKHIVFNFNDCTLVSRILEGDFINYSQILNDEYNTVITIDRNMLILGLERVSLISNKDKESKKYPVKLQINNDVLLLSCENDLGTAKDEIFIEIDGDPLEISYNPKFLLEAIRALDEEKVTIQFTNSFGPCVIKGLENPNAKYFILPLRI